MWRRMTGHEPRFLLPEQPTNVGPAFASAGVIYVAGALLIALMMWLHPPVPSLAVIDEPDDFPALIFRNVLGPAGGGGGGGNKQSMLEPKKTALTPAIRPPQPQPQRVPTIETAPPPEPPPIAATVSAVPNDLQIAIVSSDAASSGTALGQGTNGAGGPGNAGVRTGARGGFGPGEGPNAGVGPYGPGDVDVQVVPVFTPKPAYTPEAMVQRREGEVTLSCLVLATGNVGSCKVTKSLDGNNLGLDDEALKAASRVVCKPAMRRGQPVPVMVNIIISFRLR